MTKEAKIGQRAQREATGYYCGYTFKRQPVGRHALEATSQTLDFVEASLKGRTEGQQWHRVSNECSKISSTGAWSAPPRRNSTWP